MIAQKEKKVEGLNNCFDSNQSAW